MEISPGLEFGTWFPATDLLHMLLHAMMNKVRPVEDPLLVDDWDEMRRCFKLRDVFVSRCWHRIGSQLSPRCASGGSEAVAVEGL